MDTDTITIIDFGMGNLQSIKRKFNKAGANAIITSDPFEIINADKLVLPGVGHFKNAIQNLKDLKLWEVLNEAVLVKKTPILGICLGMQLMSEHSEEGDIDGLGWFDANVVKFKIKDSLKFKVPHKGWNSLIVLKPSKLFNEIDLKTEFYFVHSFHFQCNNKSDILSETVYENKFVSAVQKENIFGFQFHPEKSHDSGELLLKNFTKI